MLSFASVARAEWTVPTDCLAQHELVTAVEAALGESIPVNVRVDGEIRGAPGQWHASLRATHVSGESRARVLTSEDDSCHHLDDALAVVAALLVDEVRGSAEPAALAVPPSESNSWMAILRLLGWARVDAMPGLSFALGLEAELRATEGFSLLLGLAAWPEVRTARDGVGGRFIAMSGTLGGCYTGGLAEILELGGCATLNATLIRGDGLGLSIPASSEGILLDVALDAVVRLRVVDALWVRLALGAAVPLIRARSIFRTEMGEHVIHEMGIVIPEGSLGIEARF